MFELICIFQVNAFNDKYPGSGVIYIALVSNAMVNAGKPLLKKLKKSPMTKGVFYFRCLNK